MSKAKGEVGKISLYSGKKEGKYGERFGGNSQLRKECYDELYDEIQGSSATTMRGGKWKKL